MDKEIEKLSEVFATKEDLIEFKDEILTGQDEILEKLGILLQEKTVGDEQDKRQKKVLEIHNNALKKNKILSENQVSEIDKLRVF
jgi:hypothetical protein